MLGSSPIAAVLGAAPEPTASNAHLKSFAKTAASVGLALLLIAPGSKIPVDMRSPAQRRKDDEAAQDVAKEAGRSDWHKAKSLAGSHLATTDPTLLGRYIDKYRKTYSVDGVDCPVNFAIETAASRLVVVDCDTADQVSAFLSDAGIDYALAPTVRTPGALDAEGNWVHSEGGHFYFTLPEDVDLTPNAGTWTAPGGYAVMWRDRYLLIPPSVRPEGPYVLAGQEYELPVWLEEKINTYGDIRAPKDLSARTEEQMELGDAVDAWAESVTWSDILSPTGWTLTARTDKCGCDVWTAPGDHGSPKSATTHDTGCELGRYSAVNAPMHVWTDKPGDDFEKWISQTGSKTLSKLQAVAVTTYGGDVGKACAEMDVLPGGGLGIAAEEGVSFKGHDSEHGVDVDNLSEEITLPAAEEAPSLPIPGARTEEEIRAELQAGCVHAVVSKIGLCHSCGLQVVKIVSEAEEAAIAASLATPVEPCEMTYTAPDLHPVCNTHLQTFEFGTLCPEFDGPDTATYDDEVDVAQDRGCVECSPAGGIPVDNFYRDADGDIWHIMPNGEDHYSEAEDGADEEAEPIQVDGPDPETRHEPEPEPEDPFVAAGSQPTTTVPETFEDHPDSAVEDEEEAYGVLNSDSNGVPRIAPFSHWRDLPAPEYAIDGLIEHRALSCIIGAPGTGKSAVAIDMACSMVTGQRWQGRKVIRQRVLYLPGEGLTGAVQRIKAWERAHGKDVGNDLMLGNAIIQLGAAKEDWSTLAAYILKYRVGMIIFDTFARMSLGLDENSATDVGKAITRFDQIKKLTGSGVMVIHHTSKAGTSGRGSNALNGALDSELLISKGEWDASGVSGEAIQLDTTKQKNAPRLFEPLPLLLASMEDSVVVTGASGEIGDPLDTVAAAPMLVPEPLVETAIRIKKFAQRFPEQGITRGDTLTGVMVDEYTKARKNPEMAWKMHVAEAIDLGLRYGLLETLTGRATGSRYLASVTTGEAARQFAADEAMVD